MRLYYTVGRLFARDTEGHLIVWNLAIMVQVSGVISGYTRWTHCDAALAKNAVTMRKKREMSAIAFKKIAAARKKCWAAWKAKQKAKG